MSPDARTIWDAQAASFDDEPDHGLRDPDTRAAWEELLVDLLGVPTEPGSRVADLGCGTGSLALLLAARGHQVQGVDVSPAMLERAEAKSLAAGVPVRFDVGDVCDPELPPGAFDIVLARHVVWALPDPRASLRRWTDLLVPSGRMLLVEGFWFTEAGLHEPELVALLDPRLRVLTSRPLDDPHLWGRPVDDERYAVLAERQ
jgi:2-polyprenyl-3-methyl-5-hydroxy-6-metoxy-1,4-benzoquinol methylase